MRETGARLPVSVAYPCQSSPCLAFLQQTYELLCVDCRANRVWGGGGRALPGGKHEDWLSAPLIKILNGAPYDGQKGRCVFKKMGQTGSFAAKVVDSVVGFVLLGGYGHYGFV